MIISLEANTDIDHFLVCPGCSSKTISVLQDANQFQIFLTNADEMHVTIGVCGCNQCGLTFLNPRMGMDALFKYYGKQSRIPRTEIRQDSPFSAVMDIQSQYIHKYKPLHPGMKVLEVGCAEGFFLQRLNNRTDNALELYGVELSEKYLEQARRILPENATVLAVPIEEADFGDVKFDLIVLRHVFEHLGNPTEVLKKLRQILVPEGTLYIEVPDSENVEPSLSSFYHHEHLLYFTIPVLNNYLIANGFRPLTIERFLANPAGSGFDYPVIRSISGNNSHARLESISAGHAEKVYLDNCARNDAGRETLLGPIRRRLKVGKSRNDKFGVFGAGPHTMELLGLLENEEIQWSKIFDNNPNKHGKIMRGIPIVKPDVESLMSVHCILVSSEAFEAEMVAQVRSLVGTQIEIIRIYDHDASH